MFRLIIILTRRRSALMALACVACIMAQSALAHGFALQLRGQGLHPNASHLVSFPVISGIGTALTITPAGPKIAKIVLGSAAGQSGKLHEGDVILTVRENGRTIPLAGKSLGEVVSLIRGPVGTSIKLRIRPADGGQDFDLTLTRAAVPLAGMSYARLVGKLAPDVVLKKLGRPGSIELSTYRGNIVVLDLWASWCGACYAPLAHMQEIVRANPRWRGRVVFLAVSIDADPSAALKVIQEREWNQTTFLRLSTDEMKAMHIETIPTLLVISPAGKIVAVGDPHAISIEEQVSKLL